MCIIVYKPATTAMPTKKTLKTCFTNNDDGAGYMFAANDKVYIRKGFMTFKDFWKDVGNVRKKYGEDIPYVFHFRISTQAGVNPYICHPYPVSEDMSDLKALRSVCSLGVAHNGIIDITTTYDKKIEYNDTMKFITDYLSIIIDNDLEWYKKENAKKLISNIIGTHNKLAIMGSDGHVELIGDFVEDSGLYFSNYTYYATRYTYNPYSYNISDDDEWVDFYNPATKKYAFDTDCCPFIIEGTTHLCKQCERYEFCHDYGWVE